MPNLNINQVSNTFTSCQYVVPSPELPPIEPPVIDFSAYENDKQEKLNKAKGGLSTLAGYFLDANFLQTSVIQKTTDNGKQYFLRISRPIDDITRLYDSSSEKLTMGYIRKNLGVKENVISANNDSRFAVDRKKFIDSATLDKGRYIDIPVSELGQDSYFWQPQYCSKSECEALKAAVEKLGK